MKRLALLSVSLLVLLATAVPAAAEWAEVVKFSGKGTKNTDDFEISSRKLRVSWKAVKEGSAGTFAVTIYKGDSRVALVGNVMDSHEDSSVHRSGPGEYYLKVTSFGMNWEITVEEGD